MAKGASAVGKRSPRPRRALGKKHPISPWAAYRATSTNSESPHWRLGVVLLQDPLELFGMPLQIVKTVMGPTNLAGLHRCFCQIIMGVALDVHVSQARWQQFKNMNADALIFLISSFPKVWTATSATATKSSKP